MAKGKIASIADRDAKAISDEKLKVSFEYVDWGSEEFFFHGMERSYYERFFECVTTLKSSKEKDITEQTHPALVPKSIFNTNSSIKSTFSASVFSRLSEKLIVETRDQAAAEAQAQKIASRAFEIRVSKSEGRLHGFVWNNTFNVVWFDPAHNLYPMQRGVTKHKDAASVRCFSPDEVLRLQKIIKQLQQENEELLDAFANA